MSNQASHPITEIEAAIIKLMLELGFQHKRIAAAFDLNQGRISDVKEGRIHPDADWRHLFTFFGLAVTKRLPE